MLTMLCSAIDITTGKDLGHLTAMEARDLIVSAFVETRFARESAGSPVGLDELCRSLGALAMGDVGGGGNRNLFSHAVVRTMLGADGLDLANRMSILVPARAGALRFLHVALRDHFAFSEAVHAAGDPDDDVRDSAAWALWQIPDPRASGVLLRMLDDPYPYARGSAAGALGRLGDTRAVPALSRLLRDDTPVVSMYGSSIRDVAEWAIREIDDVDDDHRPLGV